LSRWRSWRLDGYGDAFPEDIKPIPEGLKSLSLLIPVIQAVSVIPAWVSAGYLEEVFD
jgi:hypothetical protein